MNRERKRGFQLRRLRRIPGHIPMLFADREERLAARKRFRGQDGFRIGRDYENALSDE